MGQYKAPLVVDDLFEFVVGIYRGCVLFSELEGPVKQILLDGFERIFDSVRESFLGHRFLFKCVAAGEFDHAVFHVAGPEGEANGYALHFVFCKFPARAITVAGVEFDRNAGFFEIRHDAVAGFQDFG